MKANILRADNYKSRIWELDFIRGLCVILMIFDHAMYDLGYVFKSLWFAGGAGSGFWYWAAGIAKDFYYPSLLHFIARGIVLFFFIGLCGLSCSLSSSNLKRGLRLAGVALLLSVFTWGMDKFLDQADVFTIRFGILHMLSLAILLYWALSRFGNGVVLIFGVILAALGWAFKFYPLQISHSFLGFLGLGSGFYSADYFPFLPWGGYFLMGAALGPLFYRTKKSYFPQRGQGSFLRPVLFVGRHALLFYLIHQPILYILFILLGIIVTGKIVF